MVLGKKVTIFDREWARNSTPRDGQKRPCFLTSKHSERNILMMLYEAFIKLNYLIADLPFL